MYLVNYKNNQGWLVVSSDKRTEPILASSQEGQISPHHLGPSSIWFAEIAGRLYGLKRSGSSDTTSSNYRMWAGLEELANKGDLRAVGDRRGVDYIDDGDGHPDYGNRYRDELVDQKIEILEDVNIGPLIQTKWGQEHPWNAYAPGVVSSEKIVCPTGCVAVAGAQMLYYFHYLKNKPEKFYADSDCGGRVYEDGEAYPYYFFSDLRADVWDRMSRSTLNFRGLPGSKDKDVSRLVSYVASRVNMRYTKEASGAETKDLCRMYEELGIKSEFLDYDKDKILESLVNQLPVNIKAARERKQFKWWFIDWTWDYIGHSWIIDGYKKRTIQTTSTYHRYKNQLIDDMKDPDKRRKQHDGPTKLEPAYEVITHVSTSTTEYWKMNFGWDGSDDNGEYSTSSDAIWEADGSQYQYTKRIICNFKFD